MPNSPSQPNKRTQSRSARIGALATLPVFFDLKGKPVLLIGGSEEAAWKAELLAATGAYVEVHANEFCSEMLSIANRVDLSGSINLIKQPWSLASFENKSLIVGDAETEGEAKAIYCAARAAGVPVNVIDKPAYCTFKFGTIVNRSPVVIGISTDGAAPVLGQAIRTRIEALLPATLAKWAQFAKDIRVTVQHRFAPGIERRQFWGRFAAMAFGPFREQDIWQVPANGSENTVKGRATVLKAPRLDPGMLTLNGVRLLQCADAIYFDSGVNQKVLDHARREARRHELTSFHPASRQLEYLTDEIRNALERGESVVLVQSAGASGTSTVRRLVSMLAEHCASLKNTGEHLEFEYRKSAPTRRPSVDRAEYGGPLNG